MAKNNCMSFESSKCTFHQWQETRNLQSMLYNQSHSVKQKRQSKDETKAAVLSKASYQLSRLPIRPLATLSLVCKQAVLFGSRSQPLTPQCHHTYSLYCSLYISKEANKENLFNNQELLQFVIISSILMTFMFDSGVIQ